MRWPPRNKTYEEGSSELLAEVSSAMLSDDVGATDETDDEDDGGTDTGAELLVGATELLTRDEDVVDDDTLVPGFTTGGRDDVTDGPGVVTGGVGVG